MADTTTGAGTVEAAELWRALAAAAHDDGRVADALACDLLAQLLDVDPAADRLAASLEASTPRVDGTGVDASSRADVLCLLARGWDLAGDPTVAEPLVLAALDVDPGHLDSHLTLAHLRLPGDGYYAVLDRVHEVLAPRTYLEIGMGDGSSMALARPGTRAIGVDPVPTLRWPIRAECTVVPQRSQDFLARPDVGSYFPAGPPDLVFIDGLHTFEAVLDDLIGVERLAGPRTVVLVHDTIPLDEPTQRPDRVHAFYTGDVWKLLPALADLRPDLDVATVLASPSGLTVVTGLDPANRVLAEHRQHVLDRYGALPFSASSGALGATLPDDGEALFDHLRGVGLA